MAIRSICFAIAAALFFGAALEAEVVGLAVEDVEPEVVFGEDVLGVEPVVPVPEVEPVPEDDPVEPVPDELFPGSVAALRLNTACVFAARLASFRVG